VTLDLGSPPPAPCAPDAAGAWSISDTSQFFTLASANATARVYNVSCTTACSTSWHSATATMRAPFAAIDIVFNMQPGFKPARGTGSFDASCSVIDWGSGGAWCAKGKNPTCAPAAAKTSCVRWASGRTTGNGC